MREEFSLVQEFEKKKEVIALHMEIGEIFS